MYNIVDGESIRVSHAIFKTLFEYDADLELQPKLATFYKMSADDLTWNSVQRRSRLQCRCCRLQL